MTPQCAKMAVQNTKNQNKKNERRKNYPIRLTMPRIPMRKKKSSFMKEESDMSSGVIRDGCNLIF